MAELHKKRAEQIINKHQAFITEYPTESYDDDIENQIAKAAAILTIEYIIASDPYYFRNGRRVMNYKEHSTIDYWQAVKAEIANL